MCYWSGAARNWLDMDSKLIWSWYYVRRLIHCWYDVCIVSCNFPITLTSSKSIKHCSLYDGFLNDEWNLIVDIGWYRSYFLIFSGSIENNVLMLISAFSCLSNIKKHNFIPHIHTFHICYNNQYFAALSILFLLNRAQ